MSGRAGRRGLDERGVVIMMVSQELDPQVAKGMVMVEYIEDYQTKSSRLCSIFTGRIRSHELGISPQLQHGSQFASGGGHQSRVYVTAVLLHIPE